MKFNDKRAYLIGQDADKWELIIQWKKLHIVSKIIHQISNHWASKEGIVGQCFFPGSNKAKQNKTAHKCI